MTANNAHADWWKHAVVYQVYPRSFKDTDGNGMGDIAGITEKMSYLQDLGIDALWLSPFYPSELADGGYDVMDYRNVAPELGTMADFDTMVEAAHDRGMKIIIDIVPNHTSNKHPWFLEALKAGRGSAARERYIFREGRGANGDLPPNDWSSGFGGSAWTRVDDGQWYLHIFAVEQPDLNWDNQEVHADFRKTLRFWSDHGTDGFRIDAANALAKDLSSHPLDQFAADSVQVQTCADGTNPIWDRLEVHRIYREWREVFNEYDPPRFAVAEASVVPEHRKLYASSDELGQIFNFDFTDANWEADEIRRAIHAGLEAAKQSGSTTTWTLGNHDRVRQASRYALPQTPALKANQLAKDWLLRDGTCYEENRKLGQRRARAAILLELALPGSTYLYQGEELGLFEVADIPWNRLEDPCARGSQDASKEKGRDGCRVPLPWDSTDLPQPAAWDAKFGAGASFGFSPAYKDDGTPVAPPHLPQPLWFKDFCVDIEEERKDSMLHLYRAALRRRAQLFGDRASENLVWIGGYADTVIAFSRRLSHQPEDAGQAKARQAVCICNLGPEPVGLPGGETVLVSGQLVDGMLPSDTTAWVVLQEQ